MFGTPGGYRLKNHVTADILKNGGLKIFGILFFNIEFKEKL